MMPIEEALAPQKKRLVMEMGLLIFALGTVLQWILQKLLTSPITRMVAAAHKCSPGETTKFDETHHDEFGYLKNLPVNYLKVDGSYVRYVVKNPIDRSMVEAVNQIDHTMGMKTIAEFVEDEATLGALAVIGVDYAQGYGIAKPAPLENLSENNVTQLHKA